MNIDNIFEILTTALFLGLGWLLGSLPWEANRRIQRKRAEHEQLVLLKDIEMYKYFFEKHGKNEAEFYWVNVAHRSLGEMI